MSMDPTVAEVAAAAAGAAGAVAIVAKPVAGILVATPDEVMPGLPASNGTGREASTAGPGPELTSGSPKASATSLCIGSCKCFPSAPKKISRTLPPEDVVSSSAAVAAATPRHAKGTTGTGDDADMPLASNCLASSGTHSARSRPSQSSAPSSASTLGSACSSIVLLARLSWPSEATELHHPVTIAWTDSSNSSTEMAGAAGADAAKSHSSSSSWWGAPAPPEEPS
mmetsp:Transcript_73893/g.133202  ORF Transcript_73893/g.133202 Transcript_73893/m.133202 type:complete len:226 (-) Transcript_73893:743-1420(-)